MRTTIHSRPDARREGGFSFIDVMLALVVLTIGVLALAELQVVASSGNNASKAMTSGVSIAEQKMEQIKALAYANVASEAPVTVTVGGVTYTKQVTVTTNSPVTDAKTVTVTVTWTQDGKTKTVPMATIISQ